MSIALDALRDATRGTPYEGRLWLVGGAVRDRLLQLEEPIDYDVVLEADAVALAQWLHGQGVSSIPPVVYPRFGTAMLRIAGATIEFVTARRESYERASRKPEVEPATLEEDAQRRDFTCNALMQNLHTGEFLDPLGRGLADLRSRTLRTPLDPEATFYDDPLRMLRAVRFRWQLGFEPAPGLYEAIAGQAHRLDIVSAERINGEWSKTLVLRDADRAQDDLMRLGLLKRFAPELERMVGVDQGKFHHLDVWDHSLLVLRNIGPGNLDLSLAALLHDIGKPPTRFVDEQGNVRFFGHEVVGAEMARTLLTRLRFPGNQVERVARLVKAHMRLGSSPKFTATAARRLLRDLGEDVEALLALVEADASALKPGVRVIDLEPIRRRIEAVRAVTPPSSLESPLSGAEIMEALALEPGPQVGQAKRWLLEQILEGRLKPGDRDGALELLKEYREAR